MSLPFSEHFDACLPGVAGAIRITSFFDAQVFMRRWAIRDSDRALKTLLRRMERSNSADTTAAAMRDFKHALRSRSLFPALRDPDDGAPHQ